MRKLVLSMFMSVDGFIDGLGGEFIGPSWSSDLDRWTGEMVERFDTLVYGRVAWQLMSQYWPNAEVDPNTPAPQRELARFMNNSKKIVFSRTLKDTSAWNNSVIADGSVRDVLEAEKRGSGCDMVIFAGAKFAQTAIRERLVDEYWLLTIPELFGGGSRLFDGSIRQQLSLLESKQMDTGAILNKYKAGSQV